MSLNQLPSDWKTCLANLTIKSLAPGASFVTDISVLNNTYLNPKLTVQIEIISLANTDKGMGKYNAKINSSNCTIIAPIEGSLLVCINEPHIVSNTVSSEDRLAKLYFKRYQEVLEKCYVLANNVSINNMSTLASELKLLQHLWQYALTEIKIVTNIDTHYLEVEMLRMSGELGRLTMQNLGDSIRVAKQTAISLAKELNKDV